MHDARSEGERERDRERESNTYAQPSIFVCFLFFLPIDQTTQARWATNPPARKTRGCSSLLRQCGRSLEGRNELQAKAEPYPVVDPRHFLSTLFFGFHLLFRPVFSRPWSLEFMQLLLKETSTAGLIYATIFAKPEQLRIEPRRRARNKLSDSYFMRGGLKTM